MKAILLVVLPFLVVFILIACSSNQAVESSPVTQEQVVATIINDACLEDGEPVYMEVDTIGTEWGVYINIVFLRRDGKIVAVAYRLAPFGVNARQGVSSWVEITQSVCPQ